MSERAQSRLRRQLVAALTDALRTGTKPRVPEAGRLVWGWFNTLSEGRTYHFAGPNPIALGEIDAFARLYRWPLEARHVDLLRALDRAWLDHAHAASSKREKASAVPLHRQAPLSAELFDAVF